MLDKIYKKYRDRLKDDEIKKITLEEIDVEINRQLKVDISDSIKELSVPELMKIKTEILTGMETDPEEVDDESETA